MKQKTCNLGISIGDINGIGPEVTLKALDALTGTKNLFIRLIGPSVAFKYWAAQFRSTFWSELQQKFGPSLSVIEPTDLPEIKIDVGRPTEFSGIVAARSIIRASEMALAGKLDAIVTAPISKNALQIAGYNFPGHTEFLASLAKVDTPVMLMISNKIRIAVATTHVPLQDVAGRITVEKLSKLLKALHYELQIRFAIDNPQIAVTALNPHAGEGGKIGHEEVDIISVALKKVNDAGIRAIGPFPADSLFIRGAEQNFDAFLAMYHDQGLIPFKIIAAGKGVNYTCGLPYIRTSPDHGTAFDIAGRNRANFSSMLEAIDVAKSQGSHNRRS